MIFLHWNNPPPAKFMLPECEECHHGRHGVQEYGGAEAPEEDLVPDVEEAGWHLRLCGQGRQRRGGRRHRNRDRDRDRGLGHHGSQKDDQLQLLQVQVQPEPVRPGTRRQLKVQFSLEVESSLARSSKPAASKPFLAASKKPELEFLGSRPRNGQNIYANLAILNRKVCKKLQYLILNRKI